jgi:hypothetical protein
MLRDPDNVQVRKGVPSGEAPRIRPPSPQHGSSSDPDPENLPARWRVPARVTAAKVAGAVLLALVAAYSALVGHDRPGALVAGAAAVGVGLFALRDLIAPVRLAADPDGVTVVTSLARRLRLPWSQIEAVRVDARSRYGVRSEYLEIDVGETLYLFSAYDLGARPADVARALAAAHPSPDR